MIPNTGCPVIDLLISEHQNTSSCVSFVPFKIKVEWSDEEYKLFHRVAAQNITLPITHISVEEATWVHVHQQRYRYKELTVIMSFIHNDGAETCLIS
jgi:hypothetical protein